MSHVYGVDISDYEQKEIDAIEFYYNIGMFKKIQHIIYKKFTE